MKSKLIEKCVKNRKYIFNYFFKMTGFDRELSEDLTQQTFLKIFTFFTKYNVQEKEYLTTWSLKVAKNIYYDHLRRKKEILECDVDTQVDEKFSFNNIDSGINIESEILNKDLKRNLDDVFDTLNPQQKEALEVFKLKYINGFDYDEISNLKNLSNDSCRQRTTRIRKVLKQKLTETLHF